MRERPRERERATERREMEGARALARGGRRWPKMVNSGRRVWWQWVQQREREHARETARERERERERARDGGRRRRSRGGCTSRKVWCSGERQQRERER